MATTLALTTVPKGPAAEPSKKQLRKTIDALEARLRKVEIKTILMKVTICSPMCGMPER